MTGVNDCLDLSDANSDLNAAAHSKESGLLGLIAAERVDGLDASNAEWASGYGPI